MISAYQKDDNFRKDVNERMEDREGLHLWWLGQSGFLIQWDGKHLLIDPYLSDSLTEKYSQTDKPHIRMSERVVDPAHLDFVNVVTSSHNHTDHLDAATLKPIFRNNPDIEFIVPRANLEFAIDRLGCRSSFPTGIERNELVSLRCGIQVCGVPAAHNEIKRDENGYDVFMGYIFKLGPYTVYHSGDTLMHKELITALEGFDIDIALLPINGNLPERRVAGNLSAKEAVSLAKTLEARIVVPCHYHMFTFNTVDPDEFEKIAIDEGQAFRVLKCGEGFHYSSIKN